MSVLQGGKFGHGFVAAGASQGFAGKINGLGTGAGRVIASAVLGGTVSRVTGGKFANGAATAAFGRLFNEAAHALKEASDAHQGFTVTGQKADPSRTTIVADGKGGLKIQIGTIHQDLHPLILKGVEIHESVHIDQFIATTDLSILSGLEAGSDFYFPDGQGAVMELEARIEQLKYMESISTSKLIVRDQYLIRQHKMIVDQLHEEIDVLKRGESLYRGGD